MPGPSLASLGMQFMTWIKKHVNTFGDDMSKSWKFLDFLAILGIIGFN
jgi:hypothetical protein